MSTLKSFFAIHTFIFQFLYYAFRTLYKPLFFVSFTIPQMVACWSIVQATRLHFPLVLFKHDVNNGFGGHCFNLIFIAIVLFLLLFYRSFTFENERSAVNMKSWKYTDILQHWRFAHCPNNAEHIRPGWQACRIADSTRYGCNENKNVRRR
jgi:hypothetical protein